MFPDEDCDPCMSPKVNKPATNTNSILSRCKCGDLVEEGMPHKCKHVTTLRWVNPVVFRKNRNKR